MPDDAVYPALVALERVAQKAHKLSEDAAALENEIAKVIWRLAGRLGPGELTALLERIAQDAERRDREPVP